MRLRGTFGWGAALVLLTLLLFACGRYGKPVRRASVERPPEIERVEPAEAAESTESPEVSR